MSVAKRTLILNGMIDQKQFIAAIEQISEEKGIPKEKILETIELAVAAAYKKDYGKKGQDIRAKINPQTGDFSISQVYKILDESMILKRDEELQELEKEQTPQEEGELKIRYSPDRHIMIEDAKLQKPDAKPGEELSIALEIPEDYGRIAAQTAKQVIWQRLREAEREAVYEEYKSKEGELVSGIVQRIEGENVFIDIGRTTGILPPEERIVTEEYKMGTRIRFYVSKVEQSAKGPLVILSRAHPKMISKLFEMEVPEVSSGTVVIKSIAREAGSRSKIAATSSEPNIDPIGSMVGQKGIMVTEVINELGGENVDIIEWSEEPAKFIANALSPAKALEVNVFEKKREALVKVPDDQISLAIGKKGQNVRLAAKLTGWKIDIETSKGKVVVKGENGEDKDSKTTEVSS